MTNEYFKRLMTEKKKIQKLLDENKNLHKVCYEQSSRLKKAAESIDELKIHEFELKLKCNILEQAEKNIKLRFEKKLLEYKKKLVDAKNKVHSVEKEKKKLQGLNLGSIVLKKRNSTDPSCIYHVKTFEQRFERRSN